MQQLNDFLTLIESYVFSYQWFVYFLLGTGLFFTIYLKFPQFRHLMKSEVGLFWKEWSDRFLF